MKSLYITFIPLIDGDGITKKVKAQHQAFIKYGLDMELSYMDIANGIKTYVIANERYPLGNKVVAKLKHNAVYSVVYNYLVDYVRVNSIRFVYIRYRLGASNSYINFLCKLKAIGVKVFIEIPTYPYDGEVNPNNLYLLYKISVEKHYRKQLSRVVDRIVTFSSDKLIFNTSCINISNAIDFDTIPLRADCPQHDYIKFSAVASINFWHGYDRMIRAIAEYNNKSSNKKEAYLDIVGKGRALKDLQLLVEELSVEKYVKFCGRKEGDALTKIFEDTDVCVGSLGRHRSGIYEMRALKNVEYAARGIAFIYSENNLDFDNQPYVYKVSSDERPIDIDDVLKELDKNNYSPMDIRNSVSHLSWEAQIKIILDQISQK
ncbi:MAG: glycosyltransferase [Rikenellaceae bacterium]